MKKMYRVHEKTWGAFPRMSNLERAWNGLESFENSNRSETTDMPAVVGQWLTLRSMRTNPLANEPYGPPLSMRDHTCTLYQCKKYIETIYDAPPEPPNRPPRRFSIYGCMLSGHVHVCLRDDQCIPYTDQVGMYYCVFSKDSIGVTFDPWTRGDTNYAGTHSMDFNRDHIPTTPIEPDEDSIAPPSLKNGPLLAENLWKGRRSKQGVHRIVNSSNPKYRRPYRTKDSLPEKVSMVLCPDVRTGASFLTLCRNMEHEALQIFRFVLGDSELRQEHSSRQRKRRITEAAVRIKLYVETSETTNLAPNMHVLDNIYDSITASGADGAGECIQDPDVIRRLPVLASSGLVMWLTYMISVGGYPFRPSDRGKDAAKVIFSEKGMKCLFDRVTNAINPASYFTCYRRFLIGMILSLGRSDINLRYHDPPDSTNCVRIDTLLSHEPAIFLSLTSQDVIESLSMCAANLSLATSSTTRKRKTTYCVDRLVNDLGLIKNGTLLGKKSVKESDIIFKKFLGVVTLTELHRPMIDAMTICKQPNERTLPRREEEETHLPERPTSKTIGLDDVANPYLCLVTAYGAMHRL